MLNLIILVLTNLKINNPDIYLDDIDKKCFGEYCCCKIPNINKNSEKNNKNFMQRKFY